jgi:hypothetical protein
MLIYKENTCSSISSSSWKPELLFIPPDSTSSGHATQVCDFKTLEDDEIVPPALAGVLV